ncbi:MAG: Na+/H+ antiporter subunit E [Xanthomonadales bacterium]|nr:Na+/H+ antiporter subunit E [Xanthomonadales bacterium]ODU94300.1 MAG: Na+/H+ antiporter subunit E [Rhodanobacter sp. SCN 66-43]OJY86907.1 MAG: Na+/H+ antiporter subunit E [Xanthomonadales bacterium 66-474]
MTRWLPHPWFALWLLVAWLLLQQSLAAPTIVLGIVLALVLSWALGKLGLPRVRVRSLGTLLVLLARVFADIVRSNIAVAKIIVSPWPRYTSGFVTIPLEITSPYALALLACIITATPGTIWVSHDSRRQMLLIHVLDVIDEATWIAHIKQRYEQPLLRIFR